MNESVLKEKLADTPDIEKIYRTVNEYANEHNLRSAINLLPVARKIMFDQEEKVYPVKDYAFRHFHHGLIVCKMLIDLAIPVPAEELDCLLAGTIGHVMSEIIVFPEQGKELKTHYLLDERTYEVVRLLTRGHQYPDEAEEEYYAGIKANKWALLIKLVETGILTEQYFRVSHGEVSEYMRLTREYFFPMCIYAKEYYGDIALVVSVLMEKVKLLMDVTEILSRHHQDREAALVNEMLVLEEENARIRVSIRELEAAQQR